jgi:hypothetical protein
MKISGYSAFASLEVLISDGRGWGLELTPFSSASSFFFSSSE